MLALIFGARFAQVREQLQDGRFRYIRDSRRCSYAASIHKAANDLRAPLNAQPVDTLFIQERARIVSKIKLRRGLFERRKSAKL
jgi:hypothetical protein